MATATTILLAILLQVSTVVGSNVCRMDAQWYTELPNERLPQIVSLQTSFGPPAVLDVRPDSTGWMQPDMAKIVKHAGGHDSIAYYKVEHAAVGCVNNNCLAPTGPGCIAVKSGNALQCVWTGGVDEAMANCNSWSLCQAFWCGTAVDVANSTASWCWARAATDILRDAAFHNDTAYVPLSTPNNFFASCNSANCSWIYGTGSVERDLSVNLITNDGLHMQGSVDDTCATITWNNGQVWKNANLEVETVHIVFMAHLDIGFTVFTVQELLSAYVTSFFPTAFNTSQELRARGGKEQFMWTSHAWLIDALLRNYSGVTTPEFEADLIAAIERGDITWHANPMNMMSESGELKNMQFGMQISDELDKRFNKSSKTAASQKDAPGLTLGQIGLLANAGVKMLHVGANDFSTVPALPKNSAAYHGYCNPFNWRDNNSSQSNEIAVLYCSGYSGPYEYGIETPNMMTVIPGVKDALAFLMHVDNRGPQTAPQVIEGWAAVANTFPNAELKLSSLEAWTNIVQPQFASHLPVVTNVEPGSTWIYGMSSTPRKMRWYRAVARVAADAVNTGTVDPTDERFLLFHRYLLKVPEHTYGKDGDCVGDFTNRQFDSNVYACHRGSGGYNQTANSFFDQEAYVTKAVEALGTLPLKQQCQDAMDESDPQQQQSWNSFPKFDIGQEVSLGGYKIRFNNSGAIVNLTDSRGRVWASENKPMALFKYATHSQAELDAFATNYTLRSCATACGHCAFSKCGLDKAGAASGHYSTVVSDARAIFTSSQATFLFNTTFANADLVTNYGAPLYATINITLTVEESLVINVDLQWHEKRATRMAESLWMIFAFEGVGATGWEMDKMGRWVDPLLVSVNGSQTLHGIWSGIRNLDQGVSLESLDAPLVSPGTTLSPTGAFNEGDDGTPHPERGWSFNLFNNAWSCNFPIFSLLPEQRFRWSISL
eukprot:m.235380 g.235380  ORF g.235380 m.235380 type:complete len:943 (-) comp16044_c1_seq12:64-2892(-)